MTPTSSQTSAPGQDALQAPFIPIPPKTVMDVAEIHERHPALARFRARLGSTPLMEVPSVPGGATILAKCEWGNPCGSIKDRTAYALLCGALRRHGSRPAEDAHLLEYSGGNLGISLSYLAAETGVAMRLVVTPFTSDSVLDAVRSRGARVDISPQGEGFLGAIRTAQRIAAGEPGWDLLFQHVNPVNPAFHEMTTGQELASQLAGRTPHTWVASIGSGGSLVGVMRALRQINPDLRTVGVTPAEAPYGAEGPPTSKRKFCGAAGLGYGIRQPFVKTFDHLVTRHFYVTYPDTLDGAAEFLDLTGTRIGTSSAANWLVARELAAGLPPEAVIVTMFADAGTPEQWNEIGR
jgi:cysteine synthase